MVGTPADIYSEPASLFVARFVGHMNLWPAMAEDAGRARVGALTLRHRPAAVRAGDAFTLGIRPEEVRVGAAVRATDNGLTARVTSVQFQGAFTRLTLAGVGEHAALALACDVAATALAELGVKEGAEVPVALPADALRGFLDTAAPQV